MPTGYNGWSEVDRVVQFLRDHDSLARTIAENGRRFATTHLVSEGRHCYIKVRRGRDRLTALPTRCYWTLAVALQGRHLATALQRFLACRCCLKSWAN